MQCGRSVMECQLACQLLHISRLEAYICADLLMLFISSYGGVNNLLLGWQFIEKPAYTWLILILMLEKRVCCVSGPGGPPASFNRTVSRATEKINDLSLEP